ncbi:MAG: LysM peptidoglycan-binding domain-containing protein [Bacteroidales bacterium]|nr:LysM peptidoglycan-binding domain-containing protein [Bacteroidales bacterium]
MKIRKLLSVVLLFLCLGLLAQDQQYIRHKVRWMETLYSIARKYKTDPKEIALLNNLTTGEISRGQILLIPQQKEEEKKHVMEETAPRSDTVLFEDLFRPQQKEIPPCREFVPTSAYNPIISVLLPFKESDRNTGFIEFYQGLLLAVEKMKEEGMQAVLQVFDWDEDNPDALLSSDLLGKSQVIIGPVYANDIGSTLAYFRNSPTKIVSPLDSKSNVWVSSFSNFFQVQPGPEVQQEALLKYLDPHRAALWVISEEGEQQVAPGIRKLLDNHLIPYRNFSYDVLEGRIVTEQLKTLLEVHPANQIIIASENEAFVSDAVRNLHLLLAYENIPIELFGMSRWHGFRTLDLTALHQLQVVLPLSAYVDYSQPIVNEFVATYRRLYHSEPTPFSFQGYDVAYYFLQALFLYGPHFEDCIESLRLPSLQTHFSFVRKSPEHGFSNTGVRVIHYLPNFSISLK